MNTVREFLSILFSSGFKNYLIRKSGVINLTEAKNLSYAFWDNAET